MLPLPVRTDDPNIRMLARIEREDRTGVAGVAWQLRNRPIETPLMIFKNGLLLVPGTHYTLASDTITFLAALLVGDYTTAIYWARSS